MSAAAPQPARQSPFLAATSTGAQLYEYAASPKYLSAISGDGRRSGADCASCHDRRLARFFVPGPETRSAQRERNAATGSS